MAVAYPDPFSSMVRHCLLLVLAASAALGAAPFLRCCDDKETPTTTTEHRRLGRGHEDAAAATVTSPSQDTARGPERKMAKILVPLILGFKLAGAIVVGVALVKMFLVKALILSKVALLSAIFLVAKKLLSSLGTQQHHPYLFTQQPLYYHHPHEQYQDPVHGYGYSAAGVAGALGVSGGGVEDQHAHFSEQVSSAVLQPNYNNTARIDETPTSTSSSTVQHKHRIPMVKSFTNRAPVLAYRKVVSTGRQATSL